MGKTFKYTIKEIDDVQDGYVYDEMEIVVEVSIADNGNGTLTVTPNYPDDTEFNNAYETVEVNVQKIWNDNNNQDGIRPESIDVVLYANGEALETVSLSEENDWSFSWTGLIKHSQKDNIEYTVEEVEGDNYVASIESVTDDNGNVTAIITNTHKIETTDVKVIKIWEDADNHDNYRPDFIKVQLYANGKPYGDVVTLNTLNEWRYSWKDLDKNESGKEIKYSVEEVEIPEKYSVEYSVGEDGTLIITNTQIPGEGGYEEPPVVTSVLIDNPKTGTNVFDSFGLYIALIFGALVVLAVENKRYFNR